MPFAYYGAKHGLAGKYPRPRHSLIVEPFAGSAGYSTFHAATGRHVILNDADDLVIATWRRLQTMTDADLDAVGAALSETHTFDLLHKGMAGSSAWSENRRRVTPRMRTDWNMVGPRIRRTLPFIRDWEIVHGDYRNLDNVEATWFIDPPYQPIYTTAGNDYRTQTGIDYAELAEWCQSRKGQVIVCEQSPAAWLPFTPFASQGNGVPNADKRMEVVWLSDQQQESLF